jgi:hypothetical protein
VIVINFKRFSKAKL